MMHFCPQCHLNHSSSEPCHQKVVNGNDTVMERETSIDGWLIVQRIALKGQVCQRYLVQHVETGLRAVLILYNQGAEPNPDVYHVLHKVSLAHVPEILAMGRWNNRAWYVTEELTQGTLAEFGMVETFKQVEGFRHVVEELGSALHNFAELGLRHRDFRPENLLVRRRDPLDLVIIEFGSATLSAQDLDVVAPLEISRYTAPETLDGGVNAASDWWSLGIILLEQLTHGACFGRSDPHTFLIRTLANGIQIPDDIPAAERLLLRGLLLRDSRERWQWAEVSRWLKGETLPMPKDIKAAESPTFSPIFLNGVYHSTLHAFALGAAERKGWEGAVQLMVGGHLLSWFHTQLLPPQMLQQLAQAMEQNSLSDDFRLMLVLKLLNPAMPLILRGDIVTPAWLCHHIDEGYALMDGALPDLLAKAGQLGWLTKLKARAERVRRLAGKELIALDEMLLRKHVLIASATSLKMLWYARSEHFPDSHTPRLQAIIDRKHPSEEELVILLSADSVQFITQAVLIENARVLAKLTEIDAFDIDAACALLAYTRYELYQMVSERLEGFARTNIIEVDRWAAQFRLERRLALAKVLVLLSVPEEQWLAPEKQRYISQLLTFFTQKVTASTLRGPLVRMSVGKHSGRIDITELNTIQGVASSLIEHLMMRAQEAFSLPPLPQISVMQRLHNLYNRAQLYQRDTGIDGLYLAFPFVIVQPEKPYLKTRIAPLLLWPVSFEFPQDSEGNMNIAFDKGREEVKFNPALTTLFSAEELKQLQYVADELLGRASLSVEDVIKRFGRLFPVGQRELGSLPTLETKLLPGERQLICAATLFHVSFIGQAVGEDLQGLHHQSFAGSGIESLLRLSSKGHEFDDIDSDNVNEGFFTSSSDPSQESVALAARHYPGLLIEGPPGTGKSQSIVNIVVDAIGHQRTVLIVCQKQAALDVVYKRLVAEGLEDRTLILRNARRDKDTMVRAVRTQVEELQAPQRMLVGGGLPLREPIIARLKQLESELDRYYYRLNHVDERYGLSYRELLGALCGIESTDSWLSCVSLRPHLADISQAVLLETVQPIAENAVLWLASNYENSPFLSVKAFKPEAEKVNSFDSAFRRFYQAELSRNGVLERYADSFDVDNGDLWHQWLDVHARCFSELDELHWFYLADWYSLFPMDKRQASPGREVQEQLAMMQQSLSEIDTRGSDPMMLRSLAAYPDSELNHLITSVRFMVKKDSWLNYFNPAFYTAKGRVQNFLLQQGLESTTQSIQRLWRSVRVERQRRLLREELESIYEYLNVALTPVVDGMGLLQQIQKMEYSLQTIVAFIERIRLAPEPERIAEAIDKGQKDGFLSVQTVISAAVARYYARQKSLFALKGLNEWLDEFAIRRFEDPIVENANQIIRLQQWFDLLPTMTDFQNFRAIVDSMSYLHRQLLAHLRTHAPEMAGLTVRELEDTLRQTIMREAYLVWRSRLEIDSPLLLTEPDVLEENIQQLIMADTALKEVNRQYLFEKMDYDAIGGEKEWVNITRLRGVRALRLREFIEQALPLGLMTLRPVWLMNPEVASQVLPLQAGLFDTVIYDEASQMPVEYAIPTLFRAKRVIVSGDDKQMPPAAFFTGRIEQENDDGITDIWQDSADEEGETYDNTEEWDQKEIESCSDLLQLSRPVLPSKTLDIHYRSAYRELINFSNSAFYDNRLNIPAQHSLALLNREKPLFLLEVDGCYHEQTNIQEAVRVVELLADLWRIPYEKRPSVGVVTFNQKQATLIQDALEYRAGKDPDFQHAYYLESQRQDRGEDMSLFVKNVENVQGDERDFIIFSTTFGRSPQGIFRRQFGVLGQKGGERRLNVAISRARERVVVITSMPINDISDFLTTRRAPATSRDYLQGYLEYARLITAGHITEADSLLARMGNSAELAAFHQPQSDGVVDSVAHYLRSQGWRVTSGTRNGAFYFDCLVEDASSGKYLLGIECDAPRHPLLERARTREIWRPDVLKKVVSSRHRISAQRWYAEPEQEKQRLDEALQRVINGGKPLVEEQGELESGNSVS